MDRQSGKGGESFTLEIRNASMAEFEPIMKIYQTAQAFMSRSGYPT